MRSEQERSQEVLKSAGHSVMSVDIGHSVMSVDRSFCCVMSVCCLNYSNSYRLVTLLVLFFLT